MAFTLREYVPITICGRVYGCGVAVEEGMEVGVGADTINDVENESGIGSPGLMIEMLYSPAGKLVGMRMINLVGL